jgi:hypothetical protein
MSDAFDAKASQGLAHKDRRCLDAFTGMTACERFALAIASADSAAKSPVERRERSDKPPRSGT